MKAIQICKTAELSAVQLKDMSEKNEKHVDGVRAQRGKPRRETDKRPGEQNTSQRKCGRCGSNHPPRNCPAFGKTCRKCQKQNHFARVCKSAKNDKSVPKVHAIDQELNSDAEFDFFIGTIHGNDESGENNWSVQTRISGEKVNFKIDAGAQCNVLPLNTFKKLLVIPNWQRLVEQRLQIQC